MVTTKCGLVLVLAIYFGCCVINPGVIVVLHLPGWDLHVNDEADFQPRISQVSIPTAIVRLSSLT